VSFYLTHFTLTQHISFICFANEEIYKTYVLGGIVSVALSRGFHQPCIFSCENSKVRYSIVPGLSSQKEQ